MNIPDCFYRISTKALILNDEKKFLLSLEKNGRWELPGGGLDFGEKPHAGLTRELQEETGLEITFINERPSYFLTAPRVEGGWKADVIYETQVKNLDFTPSDECMEIRFFTQEEAAKVELYPTIKEFIKIFDPKNHL